MQDRRIAKQQSTCSPGSGAYGLPSMLVTKKDFNQAQATSVFHRPLAQSRDKEGDKPAPNEYDASDFCLSLCHSCNSLGIKTQFHYHYQTLIWLQI